MITIPKFLRGLIGAAALFCILGIIPDTADALGHRPPPPPGGGPGRNVPELNIGAASGAAIILVGGILILVGRRRRKNKKISSIEQK